MITLLSPLVPWAFATSSLNVWIANCRRMGFEYLFEDNVKSVQIYLKWQERYFDPPPPEWRGDPLLIKERQEQT